MALLDIDPGQPEFASPGQLSLVELQVYNFGPPFTHPVIADKGGRIIQLQCYGSLSPKDDPTHYLDCVLKLYESYHNLQNLHRSVPLVVNCSGWTQGGGLELLTRLIQRLSVSDVLFMSNSGGLEDVLDSLADVCSKTRNFHAISSCPPHFNMRTSTELRIMQTLSYFHLAEPEAGELRWNYEPLQEMIPTVIQYSGSKQCILAVMVLGDEQDPKLLETLLCGCLVDIVVVEDDAALPKWEIPTIEDEPSTPRSENDTPEHLQHPCVLRNPAYIPYIPAENRTVRPLSPKYVQSLGQALVRSIDTANHQFHLVLPKNFVLPRIHQLHKPKIILVRGKLDTPVWAYKEPLELDKARLRRKEEHLAVKDDLDEVSVKDSVEETPWASLYEGKRSAGGKKRSSRRDLKYRSQVEVG